MTNVVTVSRPDVIALIEEAAKKLVRGQQDRAVASTMRCLLDQGSPDGRQAMTWVQLTWVRDWPGSPPRERTFNPGRVQANTRVSPDAALPWCFPFTPIRLPVWSI